MRQRETSYVRQVSKRRRNRASCCSRCAVYSPLHKCKRPCNLQALLLLHATPFPLLVQVNSGALSYLLNMLCSLDRIEAPARRNLVLWVLDKPLYHNLLARIENGSIPPVGMFWDSEWQGQAVLEVCQPPQRASRTRVDCFVADRRVKAIHEDDATKAQVLRPPSRGPQNVICIP